MPAYLHDQRVGARPGHGLTIHSIPPITTTQGLVLVQTLTDDGIVGLTGQQALVAAAKLVHSALALQIGPIPPDEALKQAEELFTEGYRFMLTCGWPVQF